jgi:hypothetical protein
MGSTNHVSSQLVTLFRQHTHTAIYFHELACSEQPKLKRMKLITTCHHFFYINQISTSLCFLFF